MRYATASLWALVCILGANVSAADVDPPSEALSAAVHADLRGDTTARSAHLKLALDADPANTLARSMLGQLNANGEWIDVDELITKWANDPVIVGYNRLRNQVQATPQGQLMLARFCSKHDLHQRAHFHWRLVLAAMPDSREATGALGLKNHRGVLMTKEQIKRYEAFLTKQSESSSRVNDLAKAASADDESGRDALKQLEEIRDEYAIRPLFALVFRDDSKIAQAAFEALRHIDSPQATMALTSAALRAKSSELAAKAAVALRARPQQEFAPQLLSYLATPIHVSGEINQIDSQMVYSIRVRREGPQAEFSHQLHGAAGAAQPLRRRAGRGNARTIGRVTNQFNRLSRQAAITNRQVEVNNTNVFAVLETATEQQLDRRPQAWWDWWAQQNDVYQPKYKPEFETYTRRDQLVSCECFLAGTLVWTDRGKVRIERLRAGDRVLTCHPESGELSFRFILATTVRPAKETTRLRLPGEDVVSTDGHPMWVLGKGWRKAKDIRVGDRLRGVRESLAVEVVEKGPEAEVYNLIVDGVNNYFVGSTGVLAHDNTLHRPTRFEIPGFVAVSE